MGFEPARYIEPSDVRLFYPPNSSHPRAEIAGDRCLLSVRVKRVFPLSKPDSFYSLQDSSDKEVGIIRSLEGMDAESQKVVEKELDRRYYTPHIERIDVLRHDGGMWLFVVQTQRGKDDFYVRNWRDNSHEIQPGRWQILSVDGRRFEIPKIEDLDARSQHLLEQLL
jgi:hypothetical protein